MFFGPLVEKISDSDAQRGEEGDEEGGERKSEKVTGKREKEKDKGHEENLRSFVLKLANDRRVCRVINTESFGFGLRVGQFVMRIP